MSINTGSKVHESMDLTQKAEEVNKMFTSILGQTKIPQI
jgi:hypothetical protein